MSSDAVRVQESTALNRPRIAGIIPARYASTRLPGKPLQLILGKPMIQRVYERCSASKILDHLVVATDDIRIRDAVIGFGGDVIMTGTDHATGTDRLAEAADSIDCDIIANIQGDQPFVDPGMIEEGVRPLLDDPAIELSTLMFRIAKEEDLMDSGVVKVVVNLAGDAMYFSRALIPWPHKDVPHPVYEHMGFYVYRKKMLKKIASLPMTQLERIEALEQLRWLENGIRIRVVETCCTDQAFCGFSVDTLNDVRRGEEMLRERGLD
jgi:3-deoxy-manno-octulosonate cytidylyltransferase (CMP-KDO synthetase)